MHSENFGFEELELWKKLRVFKFEICKSAKHFPADEKFKLTGQLIRSARSINSLLAEGHGRFTYPDQIHYCIQARGSLSETINHLIDAYDENYLAETTLKDYKIKGKEIELMLNGYINFLKKKKDEI
jgi:four helix bundle protein